MGPQRALPPESLTSVVANAARIRQFEDRSAETSNDERRQQRQLHNQRDLHENRDEIQERQKETRKTEEQEDTASNID